MCFSTAVTIYISYKTGTNPFLGIDLIWADVEEDETPASIKNTDNGNRENASSSISQANMASMGFLNETIVTDSILCRRTWGWSIFPLAE